MVSLAPPETFKRRADFLRMAGRGRKLARPGFVMQYLRNADEAPLKIGYTATKKIGNAVARNRARRRLKEAARLTLAEINASTNVTGVSLVLICRQETAAMPFGTLCASLRAAITECLR